MTEAANRFGWAKRVPGDGRQGCGMGFASMAHKFCNGRRIAEVKGASMIVALATSGVQTLRSNRYGRDRRSGQGFVASLARPGGNFTVHRSVPARR